MRALVQHFDAIGGVPLLAAFDRAQSDRHPLRQGRAGQEWDPAFAYAAMQLGLGVEVRARRGADRGPGTNLGNWVKHFFFKTRTFVDEADMERQLADWLRDQNDAHAAGAGGKTPAILLAEERQRLRPLKVDPQRPRRCASRWSSARAAPWCTRGSRTRCPPSRSAWSARCTSTRIG